MAATKDTPFPQKLLLAVLVPLLVALVAWGTLRADVNHNTESIQLNTNGIRASEQRVMTRLDRIEDKLDRLIEDR